MLASPFEANGGGYASHQSVDDWAATRPDTWQVAGVDGQVMRR
jgi:hypothetical protein